MRLKDITDVELTKSSKGWACRIDFKVQTRRQFTEEVHCASAMGRRGHRGLFGLASALWNGYRKASAEHVRLQSLPGEHNLDTLGRATA